MTKKKRDAITCLPGSIVSFENRCSTWDTVGFGRQVVGYFESRAPCLVLASIDHDVGGTYQFTRRILLQQRGIIGWVTVANALSPKHAVLLR